MLHNYMSLKIAPLSCTIWTMRTSIRPLARVSKKMSFKVRVSVIPCEEFFTVWATSDCSFRWTITTLLKEPSINFISKAFICSYSYRFTSKYMYRPSKLLWIKDLSNLTYFSFQLWMLMFYNKMNNHVNV